LVAGRLHASLAPTFDCNKLFIDVDTIPVGKDFEDYLKSQVAEVRTASTTAYRPIRVGSRGEAE
jgi:hypothetical protein